MMETRLSIGLAALEKSLRRARFCRELAVGWLAAAAFGVLVLLLQSLAGWTSPVAWLVPLLGGLAAVAAAWARHRRRQIRS